MESNDEAARDHERRVRALRELAQEGSVAAQAPEQAKSPIPEQRQPRRGRAPRAALLVLLALVVLVSGGLAYLHFRGGTSATPPAFPRQLTIPLDKLGLSCPTGLAWSPDGASLAVTFEVGQCQQTTNGTTRAAVAIFDAHTGALRTVVDLQDHLTAAGVNDTYFAAFSWSPDGKSLDFLVGYDPFYIGPTRSGIFVQPATNGQGYLLVGPSNDATRYHLPFDVVSQIWSLRDAQQVANIATMPDPAPNYTWTPTADGVSITAGTQPSQPNASGFSGSPVTRLGSATFPFWQPGTLMPISQIDPNGAPLPGAPAAAWVYLATPTLLSPDGNSIVFSYPLLARVAPSKSAVPTASDLRSCASDHLQTVCSMALSPLPDKAFAQVLSAAETGVKVTNPDGSVQTNPQLGSLPIAWRPDGKYLATILPGGYTGDDGEHVSITVSILATASGTTRNTLKLRVTGPQGSYENPGVPPFAWSPSGKQLAYFDFVTSTLVIWGGSSLPS